MSWVITILIIASLAWFWLARKKSNALQGAAVASKPPANMTRGEYHSISINAGENACNAVAELGNKRFLANEAPDLPLAGCDAANCACHFIHHEDRRAGNDDRRAAHSLKTELYGSVDDESNRRSKGPDRRQG